MICDDRQSDIFFLKMIFLNRSFCDLRFGMGGDIYRLDGSKGTMCEWRRCLVAFAKN
jgi:hypothetical protein